MFLPLLRKFYKFVSVGLVLGISLPAYSIEYSLSKAATIQGNSNIEYNLGSVYYKGLMVPQDYLKAVEWFQTGANKNDDDAQFKLAVMYSKGEGVQQDDVKAVEWYKKSAGQGNSLAQYNLAGS